ncbi:hypothetical protein WJX82_011011 [Trebouxia sp. C0006]
MPTGRPTAHPGEFESGLPRSAQPPPPPPPPPRRVLSQAQAALSLMGQAHTPLSRGGSLQPGVHQAAGHYGATPHSPQQQQQQWLQKEGQNQPNLPFHGQQGAATGWLDQRRVDQQLKASARAYVPQKSLERNAQEERQTAPELRLNGAAQAGTNVERVLHLLLPEPIVARGQPTPKPADQPRLCQQLLEQAPEQPQAQLPELPESSGGSGPSSGVESVSPRLMSCGDAEAVPPVARGKVPFATDDDAVPALSTSTLTYAPAAKDVPYVRTQKGPARIDDAPTPPSMIKVGAPNKGHVKGSADSFTLGAHRGTIHCGQQASGSLASDAAHLQTDVVSPLTAYGVSAVVEAEPAVATAVDLADSDCSTEDAFDKTSAHSSGSPETAAIDGLPPTNWLPEEQSAVGMRGPSPRSVASPGW